MKYNANGWPCVGKYIGVCPEEKWGILLCPPELKEIAEQLLEPEYQRRRVYQDELDIFNSFSYKIGKSIPEIVNEELEKLRRIQTIELFHYLMKRK